MRQFSIALAKERRKRKLTQLQAAKLIGIKKSKLSCWEENRSKPKFNDLVKLLRTFGCEFFTKIIADPSLVNRSKT